MGGNYERNLVPCGNGFNVFVTDRRTGEMLSSYAENAYVAEAVARGMELNLDEAYDVAERRKARAAGGA